MRTKSRRIDRGERIPRLRWTSMMTTRTAVNGEGETHASVTEIADDMIVRILEITTVADIETPIETGDGGIEKEADHLKQPLI